MLNDLKISAASRQKISFPPRPQKIFACEPIRFWSVSARPAAERRGGRISSKISNKIGSDFVVNILRRRQARQQFCKLRVAGSSPRGGSKFGGQVNRRSWVRVRPSAPKILINLINLTLCHRTISSNLNVVNVIGLIITHLRIKKP